MICEVTGPDGVRVGKAKSHAQAIDSVVSEKYKSRSLNADEVADYAAGGGKIEDWMPEEKVVSSGSDPVTAVGGADGQG